MRGRTARAVCVLFLHVVSTNPEGPALDVCRQIIGTPGLRKEAWSRRDEAERACGADAVAAAIALGLVEIWHRPHYEAVILTPYGAFRMGVEIDEVWANGYEEVEHVLGFGPLAKRVKSLERVKVETPIWAQAGSTEGKPIRLPRHARIGSTLLAPAEVADKHAGPDYLLGHDGTPVVLFNGDGQGVPVMIDQRISIRKRRKPCSKGSN